MAHVLFCLSTNIQVVERCCLYVDYAHLTSVVSLTCSGSRFCVPDIMLPATYADVEFLTDLCDALLLQPETSTL